MTDLGLIITVIIFFVALFFTGRDILRSIAEDKRRKQ